MAAPRTSLVRAVQVSALALAATLAGGAEALAAEPVTRPVVVVLPVEVSGDVPANVSARWQAGIVDGLARGTFDARARTEAAPAQECQAACVREVATEERATWIVRPRVQAIDRDFSLTLELREGRSGEVVSTRAGVCEICAVEESVQALADHAAVLGTKLDALVRTPPVLHLESRPEGARIAIDGVAIGNTPIHHELDPGPHHAVATLPGYETAERDVVAVAGTDETVRFELTPSRAPSTGLRTGGITALTLGLVAVGGGAALLAIDGRPYTARCDGTDVDADGDCRFRYDTLAGGATLVAVGAAAAIAGAVLIGIHARRNRTRRTSRVTWRGAAVHF